MPSIEVNGCLIQYELLGEGKPVALQPGGRLPMDAIAPLGRCLAATGRYRVLVYDRRNCGASDTIIAGEEPESDLWAHDLAALLKALGMAPAWVGGYSAGCRTSALTAVRHPEAVKGLLLWAASGGAHAAEALGQSYHDPYIEAARRGGMNAVLQTPFFAERVQQNARNGPRLRAMPAEAFIATMRHWKSAFTPEPLFLGVQDRELAALSVPTLIIASDDQDQMHPPAVAAHIHRLVKGSELRGPIFASEEYYAGLASPGREGFHRLMEKTVAPVLIDFLDRHTRHAQ